MAASPSKTRRARLRRPSQRALDCVDHLAAYWPGTELTAEDRAQLACVFEHLSCDDSARLISRARVLDLFPDPDALQSIGNDLIGSNTRAGVTLCRHALATHQPQEA